MNKKIAVFFIAVFFIMSTGTVEAFVPQTPHLLHMVIQKIKRPGGLLVHQGRSTIDASGSAGGIKSAVEPDSLTGPGIDTGANSVGLNEKLVYVFPGKFRSEIISDTVSRFYVESDSKFIKVSDGRIVSLEKSPVDFYTDILLYRNHESLVSQLQAVGVDTEKVTFQRLDDKICYFIGQPSIDQKDPVGLWIEKTSLFPVRYVIKKNGWIVSFHYENWQRVSKTWYPMQITIFVDNLLFSRIDVQQIELASGFSKALFDVNRIQRQYPFDGSGQEKQETSGGIGELDRQIENFRKLYE